MNYINKEVVNMINDLYVHETFSYQLYCYYSLIAKKMGFEKVSEYMYTLAKDKITAHTTRTFDFLLSIKECPNPFVKFTSTKSLILDENQLKKDDLKSLIETLLESMLTNELDLRNKVLEIANKSLSCKEYEVFEYIQWFVKDSLVDIGELKAIIFSFKNKELSEIDNNISFREDE